MLAHSGSEVEMEPHSPGPPSARQTIVTVILTGMTVMFFLLLLLLITGGYFIYLAGTLIAIGAFGAFHYFLWGRLLTQETASEREEEQLRQRALGDDDPEWSDGRSRG
jgi:hypothetical protein